jgi:hypothetical protein
MHLGKARAIPESIPPELDEQWLLLGLVDGGLLRYEAKMLSIMSSSAYLCAITVLGPSYSNRSRVSVAKPGRAVVAFGSGMSTVTAGCCGMRQTAKDVELKRLFVRLHGAWPAVFQPFPTLYRLNWTSSGCFRVWHVHCDGGLLRYAANCKGC